jgi:cysteinyl-tRNA synthetase
LLFDVLARHLIARGQRVRYVQNVTDIDDSILKRARELGIPYDELGDRYTAVYMEDMAALNARPADVYPTATDAIPAMQEMIGRLIDAGHAYLLDNGDVYFRVASSSTFGELSRLPRAAMLTEFAAQDDATLDDDRKDDALDFPLWRAARPGEPAWESPWGRGRPGWHIECSTMALQHLGPQVDIHGGGDDLVFPHHECEIAQSEAATGVRPFSLVWVHVAMVRLGGEKMSKSLGNLVFVRELLQRYSANALRAYVLATHYRRPLDYDESELRRAEELADRLELAAAGDDPRPYDEHRRAFTAALDDDLDTGRALAILDNLALSGPGSALRELADCLGLDLPAPA